jgi:hypothetical protein
MMRKLWTVVGLLALAGCTGASNSAPESSNTTTAAGAAATTVAAAGEYTLSVPNMH